MLAKRKILIFLLVICSANLYYSLNQNLRNPVFHHASEIWADKAGYYMYLPATFIHNWDPLSFPDSIESKIGFGFKANIDSQYLFTKYPPGVAVLETPIFLIGHMIIKIVAPDQANGFTAPYQIVRIVSVHAYLFIGLLCLALLALNFGRGVYQIIGVLSIIIFGTNVWYSAIWQPGMSHLYSFALVAILLYFIYSPKNSLYWLKIGLLLGLIGCTRLVNLVIIFPLAIGYYHLFASEPKKLRALLGLFIGTFIGLVPQIAHSLYLKNMGLVAYANEGFPNWLSPKFDALYWSATNGIAIYTPIFAAVMLYTLYTFVINRNRLDLMSLALFIGISYIYGSWWCPTMGCCIGHRSFIDFLPIFFLPLIKKEIKPTHIVMGFIILGSIYTSYLSYKYPGCLDDGGGIYPWKWTEYFGLWK
jgi:hypothetical protein